MNELMTVIVTWLSYSVGLPVNYTHPAVVIVPHENMVETWARERGNAVSQEGFLSAEESLHELELYGFYADLTQTIYLDEQWSVSSMADVSLLVHEMAHHLQAASTITYACAAEREQVAYKAQSIWLENIGLDLNSEFKIDPMTLLLRTRCMH